MLLFVLFACGHVHLDCSPVGDGELCTEASLCCPYGGDDYDDLLDDCYIETEGDEDRSCEEGGACEFRCRRSDCSDALDRFVTEHCSSPF